MYAELKPILDAVGTSRFEDVVITNIAVIVKAYQTMLYLREKLNRNLDFDARFWEVTAFLEKYGIILPKFNKTSARQRQVV